MQYLKKKQIYVSGFRIFSFQPTFSVLRFCLTWRLITLSMNLNEKKTSRNNILKNPSDLSATKLVNVIGVYFKLSFFNDRAACLYCSDYYKQIQSFLYKTQRFSLSGHGNLICFYAVYSNRCFIRFKTTFNVIFKSFSRLLSCLK